MLITPAFAQTAGGQASGASMLVQMLPLVLIFVVFWFLLIRPQQKRMKEHRAMIEALKKGDEIVTQGGLVGKITSVRDNELEVEIAAGVKVRVIRSTVTGLVNRTQPAAANS